MDKKTVSETMVEMRNWFFNDANIMGHLLVEDYCMVGMAGIAASGMQIQLLLRLLIVEFAGRLVSAK